MSKKYPDVPPGTPNCLCCHDTGLIGGDIAPPNDCPYKFCLCREGRALQRINPEAVDRANETRAKLLEIAK